jgi:hypothetical protein
MSRLTDCEGDHSGKRVGKHRNLVGFLDPFPDLRLDDVATAPYEIMFVVMLHGLTSSLSSAHDASWVFINATGKRVILRSRFHRDPSVPNLHLQLGVSKISWFYRTKLLSEGNR